MNKLLVVIGPTAVGKSDLAILLAKKYNGEIISADSRQVYRNLDLGTGKVFKDEGSDEFLSEGVLHYGIDIVDAYEQYNISDFQKYCNTKMKEIWNKGKLPILCGGSPLYVISVLEGWKFPKTKPNLKLREELENKEKEELFLMLEKIDKKRAGSIDKYNKRRLVRALEIALEGSEVGVLEKKPLKCEIITLGIKKNREDIKELIRRRLDKRIKEGMIKEVEELKANGISSKRLDDLGLEYRYVNLYLEGKLNLEEMKEQLYNKICQFAKRQMTWFKKFENVNWIDNDILEADKILKKFKMF